MMLADHDIHLWYSSVLKPEAVRKNLCRRLSEDEREKAARFRFNADRNAYIMAHGLLRSILAHYIGIKPEELQFAYGSKGKPVLQGAPLYFNASHSKDMTVYAIAREPKLGIDIEFVHLMPDLETIAKRFFSAMEYDDLVMLDRSQRYEGFFNCWTRKEAYVKAIGDGLYAPLDQFQVTLKPKQPASFITIQGDRDLASEWSLFDWKPGEDYAGAVAIYGKGWRLEEKSTALIGV